MDLNHACLPIPPRRPRWLRLSGLWTDVLRRTSQLSTFFVRLGGVHLMTVRKTSVSFAARLALLGLVSSVASIVAAGSAHAAPRTPKFGYAIDDYAGYDGARKCDPSAKPGVLAFQRLVLAAYPGTGAGSIGRACSSGGSSEHHEGRAWDWGVNASVPSQKAAADSAIQWLLAKDRHGHQAAMARRVGLMYLIWNRRIWMSGSGWSVYCVQKKRGCVDPDDGGERHPHSDHVHFSFSWAGARKQTTFWNPQRSMIAAIEAKPNSSGYWLLGRNGSIYSFAGAGYYGSLAARYPSNGYVAMASSSSGGGYWIANANGRVRRFGDAPRRPDAMGRNASVVDMAATPSGRGYWLLTRKGRVLPFGDAKRFGDLSEADSQLAGMAATPTGQGYWLTTAGGRTVAFGDAEQFGEAADVSAEVVGMAGTPSGEGYWMALSTGRVLAFGDASVDTRTPGASLTSPVTGITSTGHGYWLVTAMGRVVGFGDARR